MSSITYMDEGGVVRVVKGRIQVGTEEGMRLEGKKGRPIFEGDTVKKLLDEVGRVDAHGYIIDGLFTEDVILIRRAEEEV